MNFLTKPFKLKGGSTLNLRGFSKRVVDKEIGSEKIEVYSTIDDLAQNETGNPIKLYDYIDTSTNIAYREDGAGYAEVDHTYVICQELTIGEGNNFDPEYKIATCINVSYDEEFDAYYFEFKVNNSIGYSIKND